VLGRATAKDNIKFDGLSRVSHVTDATDWRVEYPFVVLTPDTEAEMAALVAGCVELGLTIIPRGGGTGYTGGAVPLTWKSAVINTEKLEQMTEVEFVDLPGVAAGGHGVDRGRRGHPACGRRGRARRPCVRGRPHQRRGQLHRRQHRDERRRQEGRAVGHCAGQPGQLAHGHAPGQVAGGGAPEPQPGQDPRRPLASFELRWFDATGKKLEKHRAAGHPRRVFRKEGLGKDVTDKFLAGLPGIQKEGCDGLITSARWVVHKMPAHVRTVCLEFFGNPIVSVPSIVEIKNYLFEEAKKPGGAILAGLEHLDDRYLKAVGYATKSKRGGLPKMVLVGDIVGDDENAVARATSEVVRIANSRSGEGFVAVSADARKKFWLDRKRTAAISPPHQRLQGERGRGDPAGAHGRVHPGHRAHQHRAEPAQQAGAGRPAGSLLPPAACRWARPTTPARSPAPSCWKTGCSRPWPCCARCARCGCTGCTTWM
jgi:FAD/FMN-containing dehydrogenase